MTATTGGMLRRNLPCCVDLLLTRGADTKIPHARLSAGHWNDYIFWLRGQDLNL